MQFSKIRIVTMSFVALVASAAAQGYVDTCAEDSSSSKWDDATKFYRTECKAMDGRVYATSLNLNRCLANINGQIAIVRDGNFFNSVDSCRLQTKRVLFIDLPTSVLMCEGIRNNAGNKINIAFNMNEFLSNRDGFLACIGGSVYNPTRALLVPQPVNFQKREQQQAAASGTSAITFIDYKVVDEEAVEPAPQVSTLGRRSGPLRLGV